MLLGAREFTLFYFYFFAIYTGESRNCTFWVGDQCNADCNVQMGSGRHIFSFYWLLPEERARRLLLLWDCLPWGKGQISCLSLQRLRRATSSISWDSLCFLIKQSLLGSHQMTLQRGCCSLAFDSWHNCSLPPWCIPPALTHVATIRLIAMLESSLSLSTFSSYGMNDLWFTTLHSNIPCTPSDRTPMNPLHAVVLQVHKERIH